MGSGGAKKELLLTTGSHHYQAFWIAGERPGELALFPFDYSVGPSGDSAPAEAGPVVADS